MFFSGEEEKDADYVDPFYDVEGLVDITRDVGKVTSAARVTIINWFNKWLVHINSRKTFESMHIGDVNASLFGKFAFHLFENVGIDSCLSYISHFKMVILEKFPDTKLFDTNSTWYTNIRDDVQKRYYARAQETGTGINLICNYKIISYNNVIL